MVLRKPSHAETSLLEILVGEDFLGAAALREQLRDLLVETIDADGSLRLEPTILEPANVGTHIPVEVEIAGSDGVSTFALLHVQSGLLAELEVYREDGSDAQINEPFEGKGIRVIVH
jgi:hypothetical protein